MAWHVSSSHKTTLCSERCPFTLCEFLLSNSGHQVYVASTLPVEPSCQPSLPILIRLQPRWIKTFPASFNHCLLKSSDNTEDECFGIQIQGFSWCSPSNLLFCFHLSKNQSTFWGLKETSTLSEGLPVSVLFSFPPAFFYLASYFPSSPCDSVVTKTADCFVL